MSKLFNVFAAGVVAAASLGSVAYAENEDSAFAQNVQSHLYGEQTRDYGFAYNGNYLTRAAAHNDGVSVLYIGQLPLAEQADVKSRAVSDPSLVQELQAKIRSDAAVSKALQARNISVSNVIGSNHSADGATTYIVR